MWDMFLGALTRTAKTHYSKRRICLQCSKPISNVNKSGLCRPCIGGRQTVDKGYKYKTSLGYMRVWVGSKYVFEHLYIWEQAHQRQLHKGWVIHHANGIKDDNRIENLYAMSRKNHRTDTRLLILQIRIRELEELLSKAQK